MNERMALEQQIMEFGQTPKQLFTKSHPCKISQVEIAKTDAKLLKPSLVKEAENHIVIPDVSDHGEDVCRSQDSSPKKDDTSLLWDKIETVIADSDVICEHNLHRGSVTHALWNQSGECLYSISAGKNGLSQFFYATPHFGLKADQNTQ